MTALLSADTLRQAEKASNTEIADALANTGIPVTAKPVKAKAPRKPRPARAERFWSKVGTNDSADNCWLWKAGVSLSNGYGQFHDISPASGKPVMRSSHKVAFELGNNVSLEPGEVILHSRKCVSKLCCRPSHLRRGSQSENMRDASACGHKHGRKKLSPEIAKLIVAHYRGDGVTKMTKAQLAREYGTSPQNIEHVLSGRSWSRDTGIPKSGRALNTKAAKAAPKVEKRSRRTRADLEQGAVAAL